MINDHTAGVFCLGFPRMGTDRALKKALEKFWKRSIDQEELLKTARELRARHWAIQKQAGLRAVTVGDFSLYDHVLDTACLFNMIPPRFRSEPDPLIRYFMMARGNAASNIPPMEMTKWFDTNYHYTVPEITADMNLKLCLEPLLEQLQEALDAGFTPTVKLIGPVTLLRLSKVLDEGIDRWALGEKLAALYASCITQLSKKAPWIQLDEPVLALDLSQDEKTAFKSIYAQMGQQCDLSTVLLTTYFGPIDHNLDVLDPFEFGGLHIDMTRGPNQLQKVLKILPDSAALSLGLVDGRNIWRNEYQRSLATIEEAQKKHSKILISSSCSLLHSPIDLDLETKLNAEIKGWMAFAKQKCQELSALAQLALGTGAQEALEKNRAAWSSRRNSTLARDPRVRERVAQCSPSMLSRTSPWDARQKQQSDILNLPLLPTTTIGSFPQTPEVRRSRRLYKAGELSLEEYRKHMQNYIRDAVEFQEELDIDVLVHGEPERNDMVEYFGRQLNGFCFTEHGWVQSYGSRCVRPPIIYGDVSRPKPMTVDWATFAQAQTSRIMKGMLTGPVTILCWSFVRNDQPRKDTCHQIALAIRDEVADLEMAGIRIIQIDEAAFREGLPLRQCNWNDYLQWAVDCFRLTSCVVKDTTQIHTHMCYSEFNDIVDWIAKMDADVISIEASRSRMEILEAFKEYDYPNEIGPGVYDIHSERVPSVQEICGLLEAALELLPARKLWVNPDCGLKTRAWPETRDALRNMSEAAKRIRASINT